MLHRFHKMTSLQSCLAMPLKNYKITKYTASRQ